MAAGLRPPEIADATLDRTTNAAGELSRVTRAQVRSLDAGSHFGAEFAGEPVPVLAEVLDEFLGVVALAMELKEPVPEVALSFVARMLHEKPDADLRVASFLPEPLAQARDHLPAAPRSLVLRRDQPLPDEAIRTELGLSGVFARAESMDERFVVDCRRSGLGVFAYVVNDVESARRLASIGVDGLISDDPAIVRSVIPRVESGSGDAGTGSSPAGG